MSVSLILLLIPWQHAILNGTTSYSYEYNADGKVLSEKLIRGLPGTKYIIYKYE